MTEREITIIDRLNRLGVDNTMWGVVSHDGWLTSELHGTDQHVTVPAHIYVHREDPKHAALDPDVKPDATLISSSGVIDLYFIGRE